MVFRRVMNVIQRAHWHDDSRVFITLLALSEVKNGVAKVAAILRLAVLNNLRGTMQNGSAKEMKYFQKLATVAALLLLLISLPAIELETTG